MKRIPLPPDAHLVVRFEGDGDLADRVHLLGVDEIDAVNAAIAAGRPLLVRGDPGTGKSQLARAAAKALGRALVQYVVDSHTELRDLLWRFDAVQRLADAQLAGSLNKRGATRLEVRNYLHPGPLWWVFDWADAQRQADRVGADPPAQPDGRAGRQSAVPLLESRSTRPSPRCPTACSKPWGPGNLPRWAGAGGFAPPGCRRWW